MAGGVLVGAADVDHHRLFAVDQLHRRGRRQACATALQHRHSSMVPEVRATRQPVRQQKVQLST
jgi:hypothetical protein